MSLFFSFVASFFLCVCVALALLWRWRFNSFFFRNDRFFLSHCGRVSSTTPDDAEKGRRFQAILLFKKKRRRRSSWCVLQQVASLGPEFAAGSPAERGKLEIKKKRNEAAETTTERGRERDWEEEGTQKVDLERVLVRH